MKASRRWSVTRLPRRYAKSAPPASPRIIVEQNAVAALELSDRAVILDTGEVVFDGTAKEVLESEELRHKYLAI